VEVVNCHNEAHVRTHNTSAACIRKWKQVSKYVNSPGRCIGRKRDATAVQHAPVIQSDVWIVGADGEQFWSHWIDAQTLGFSMRTDVLIKVDEHILRPVRFAHFWSTQVKLPAIKKRGEHYAQHIGDSSADWTWTAWFVPADMHEITDTILSENGSRNVCICHYCMALLDVVQNGDL